MVHAVAEGLPPEPHQLLGASRAFRLALLPQRSRRARASAVAAQPSRALVKAGVHPVADVSLSLVARIDRVSDVVRCPRSSGRRPGALSRGPCPTARARAVA